MKMLSEDIVTGVVLLLSWAVLSQAAAHGQGPRCFDCNYAPSGFIRTGDEWTKLNAGAGSGEVGTNLCALQRLRDSDRLDKWACKSGTCYIRRDPNGMVYRGCGDQQNLPWGVNPRNQCGYMGPGKEQSQWFFCEGDLCNDGQFGEPNRCGDPPAVADDEGVYGPGGVGINGKNLAATDLNPCDGSCYNNPSGLYPDPFRPGHFIQCGCDFKDGKSCKCCKPYYLRCPRGSKFDDRAKVCNKDQKRSY